MNVMNKERHALEATLSLPGRNRRLILSSEACARCGVDSLVTISDLVGDERVCGIVQIHNR